VNDHDVKTEKQAFDPFAQGQGHGGRIQANKALAEAREDRASRPRKAVDCEDE
jgi:hypothetical protein